MFRRIELIYEMSASEQAAMAQWMQESNQPDSKEIKRFCKSGLTGEGNGSNDFTVWDSWSSMNSPRRTINKKCRFFFTEAGWNRYGRPTIPACQQKRQKYRVIAVKECTVDVIYRDEVQVAVRPRKQRKC